MRTTPVLGLHARGPLGWFDPVQFVPEQNPRPASAPKAGDTVLGVAIFAQEIPYFAAVYGLRVWGGIVRADGWADCSTEDFLRFEFYSIGTEICTSDLVSFDVVQDRYALRAANLTPLLTADAVKENTLSVLRKYGLTEIAGKLAALV